MGAEAGTQSAGHRLWGRGPRTGRGYTFWRICICLPAVRWGSPRTVPTSPQGLRWLLTCRWVMFLSMFIGDVTQFWDTYL